MTKPLTETEREMVRLAEEAARDGMVRRLPMWVPEEIKPIKKGRGWPKGKPRSSTGKWKDPAAKTLVTVAPGA